jgi:hypothetical protein
MRYICILAVALLIFGCIDNGAIPSPTKNITSFEECVKAGYPILESYPRQCRTPDGRNFISGTDFMEVNQNTSCSKDKDCMLLDKSLGFGCCWSGACAQINYSEDKWVARNKEWFESVQDRNCPDQFDCGPAPLCPIRAIDTNFTASCINNTCKKIPIKLEENITANITIPNITENITMPVNKTLDNKTENTTLSGILFGNGSYLLVLEDISTIDNCALLAITHSPNQSEITKLKGCPSKDVNWVSPEGRVFRIKIVKTAAGYTKNESWADIRVYG